MTEGCGRTSFNVIVSDRGVPLPQALTGVTVSVPFVAVGLKFIEALLPEFVMDAPVPEYDQIYEVAFGSLVTEYALLFEFFARIC
jgi:hypothetical protein